MLPSLVCLETQLGQHVSIASSRGKQEQATVVLSLMQALLCTLKLGLAGGKLLELLLASQLLWTGCSSGLPNWMARSNLCSASLGMVDSTLSVLSKSLITGVWYSSTEIKSWKLKHNISINWIIKLDQVT